MTTALAWIAIITLSVSLGSTILTIWLQLEPRAELLQLTELVLSWEVISGGLAVGAGSTFNSEIKSRIQK